MEKNASVDDCRLPGGQGKIRFFVFLFLRTDMPDKTGADSRNRCRKAGIFPVSFGRDISSVS